MGERMAPGLLGQRLVILRGAAQNLGLFFILSTPSTRGLVSGGAGGRRKQISDQWVVHVAVAREGLCSNRT